MYKTRIDFSGSVIPSTLRAFATFFALFICFQQSVLAQPITINGLKTIDKFSHDPLMPLQYHLTSLQYSPDILPLTKRLNIESQTINWAGIAITSTALAGIYTGLFSYEQDKRWGVPQVSFHFAHSISAKGADKAGIFTRQKPRLHLSPTYIRFQM